MAAAGAGRGDAKNGGAVGFRGAGVVGGAPGRGRPRIRPEIVPARLVPAVGMPPRACQPGVGRAPPPSDHARCMLSPAVTSECLAA